MPIAVGKSVNFFLTKFIPKAGQIYPLPLVENPYTKPSGERNLEVNSLESRTC